MSNIYETREFMIFNVSELNKINFNEVIETSLDTVRKSIDLTKTFVKWDGVTIPSSVLSLTTSEGPYNYTYMLALMSTPEWQTEIIAI
tara:strand:- start:126 stop:389 length:264 start_codon:yes stop_codon:yes gene_type:complete